MWVELIPQSCDSSFQPGKILFLGLTQCVVTGAQAQGGKWPDVWKFLQVSGTLHSWVKFSAVVRYTGNSVQDELGSPLLPAV